MNATDKHSHAIENAKFHAEEIFRLVTAEASDEMLEMPLSVTVRKDWHEVGGDAEMTEYCILLSTGGPALRIYGELGRFNEPANATLQWQDWGTPWTDYVGSTIEQDDAVLAFARNFYFGE